MELVVHGTKHGYKSNFINNVEPTFALDDIRNGVNNENPMGKSAYSLSFMNGGCVFTKYTIIRDTLRSYATGNIAFSLFLPANRELKGKGTDVKLLLDKLTDNYFDKYVINNNLNRGETTLIHEDWNFVQKILNEFSEQAKDRKEEEITSGSQDPAFHYYKSESELIEHLDKPFQEEYRDYKQIYFIDNNLQGLSNPLNVLRNSGIEVNPDLKNEHYYLNNFNRSKSVKIAAFYNNKWNERSDGKENNHIRAKWPIEIKYSKDERCYEPIFAKGTISDLTSKIYTYLEIKGNQIMIKYDAFNNPEKKIKQISFEIKKSNGNKVDGVEITYKTDNQEEQKTTDKTISFTGEDIIKQWKISAKKESENLFSDTILVMPDIQNRPVELTLNKQKTIEILAFDEANNTKITDFNVHCGGKYYHKDVRTIVFVNDEIDKPWDIKVSKEDGRDIYSGKIENYHPKYGENPLKVPCKKTTEIPSKTYKINAGVHRKTAPYCPEYSNNSSGSDIDKCYINPNKGFVFKEWKLKNDTLEAQYEKKKYFYKNPKFVAGALVLGIGIGVLIYFLVRGQNKDILLTADQIKEYVQGDSLMLDKLNDYKKKWEQQKPELETVGGRVWFNPTTWFVGSNEENPDSTEYNNWDKSKQSIDKAIKIRNFIEDINIVELKNQEYLKGQLPFKKAIESIDSTKYAEVKNQIGDVSGFTLTQIADSINAILNPKQPQKVRQPQEAKKEEKKPEVKKETAKKTEQLSEQPNPQKQKNTATDKTSKILEYIKGSDLQIHTLNQYLKDANNNKTLKASIDLCIKLWSLDGSKNKSYSSYQKELNKDTNLKNSKLKDFVDKMCNKEKPKYIKELPKSDHSKKLSDIIIRINELDQK